MIITRNIKNCITIFNIYYIFNIHYIFVIITFSRNPISRFLKKYITMWKYINIETIFVFFVIVTVIYFYIEERRKRYNEKIYDTGSITNNRRDIKSGYDINRDDKKYQTGNNRRENTNFTIPNLYGKIRWTTPAPLRQSIDINYHNGVISGDRENNIDTRENNDTKRYTEIVFPEEPNENIYSTSIGKIIDTLPPISYTPSKKKKKINKGEERCREIFQDIFQTEFKSIRPDWLKNPTTGKNLEIDGFAESIVTPLGVGLGFEYNGAQHSKYVPHFHGDDPNNFIYQAKKDIYKEQICKKRGILLIIIPHFIPFEQLEKYITDALSTKRVSF